MNIVRVLFAITLFSLVAILIVIGVHRYSVKEVSTIEVKTIILPTNSEHIIYGLPSSNVFFVSHIGYVSGYNLSNKIPDWVSYRLIPMYCAGKKKLKTVPDFFSDLQVVKEGLPTATPDDYARSGYDMGHCFSHADAKGRGEECEIESYSLVNVMPQTPLLNRKIWLRLEEQIRKWANQYGEIWVITGPVDTITTNIIGNGVSVPEFCFKIVIKTNDFVDAIAFMMPQNAEGKIEQFIIAIDEIEALTGLDFFGELPDNIEFEMEKRGSIWKK